MKLLVLMLLAVSGQVSGYEGESVDEGYFASYTHPQNHNDNPLEKTEPKSSWNSIAFQSMDERHKCQMSLDDDGLGQYGIQQVGDLVFLSIPDQGIEGVYAVTDIRSLKPPKIPSGEDIDGEAGYCYITGIFEHTSEDVWKLTFDKGDTIEVTSSHPFLTVDGLWTAAGTLKPGDKVQTKDGICVLVDKSRLEGEHTVYNITVSGTHNYLVGQEGLVVHNSCGTIAALDALATKFINNFSPAVKKSEIAEWWAKGFPKFFQRGTFFERLMAKSGRYSGWTITPHNWPVIDFQKIIGGKVKVVSMKTTITTDVTSWMSTNADHLVKLNNMKVNLAKDVGNIPEVRALHVYVKKSALANYSNWAAAIKAKYPDIKEVLISSIEDEFSL